MPITKLLSLALLALATLEARTSDDLQVTPDIVCATYGTRQLKLDVYRPRSSKPLPGIVVIRGGGWKQGDKLGFAPIARNLAVRWMRAEGKRYGVATDSIGVIGGSAGGHLVTLLGTSYKEARLEGDGGHAGIFSRVQAVVAMAPVVAFASDADKSVLIAQSQEMVERCQNAGVRASLSTFKGAPHGFWNNAKWFPETIEQSAAFFHEILGN